jgi:hypothetical protein
MNRVIVLARAIQAGGIDSLESISGLLKNLKIGAQLSRLCNMDHE